ncbi:VacJ family lipoprotein [Xanthomonas sp. WHRI 1810A]|uniref:MlaA family lipoprotein n=1 Tax=Xanthomonas sp. WHRI 1810A TaxID=3161565 RepID=UPI0032E88B25
MSKSVFTLSRRYPSGPRAFTWGRIISDALFLRPLALGLAMSSLLACAQVAPQNPCDSAPTEVHDPVESFNRDVFGFNQVLDGYVLKPVARGYRALPDFVQSGVHNFVSNFAEPKVLINDLLQGNVRRSGNTLARFTFNTTVGLLGFIDVATPMGLAHHSADFGQTFGVWGLANGPIVELPLLGTHNTRDTAGVLLSFLVDPFGSGNSDTVDAVSSAQGVGGVVDGRAEALPLTDTLETRPDYYRALRDSTAVRRAEKVAEGKTGAIGPEAPHACPLP